MILINYNGTKIQADNNGVPVYVYSYWTDETLLEIQEAYLAGNWETVEEVATPPLPDWQGFVEPFYVPAFGENTPFHIIETAVQTAQINAETNDQRHAALSLARHWTNCISGLTNPAVRSVNWLTKSWVGLLLLLNENSVALTEEQRLSIEALLRSYNLLE